MIEAFLASKFWILFSAVALLIGFIMDIAGVRTWFGNRVSASPTGSSSRRGATWKLIGLGGAGAAGVAAAEWLHHHRDASGDIASLVDSVTGMDGPADVIGAADIDLINIADIAPLEAAGDLLGTLADLGNIR